MRNFGSAKIPPRYVSVDRYLVTSALTILFTPISTIGLGMLYESIFDPAAVPSDLTVDLRHAVLGMITIAIFSIFLGWKIWLPLFVASIIVGLPLWALSVNRLLKRNVAPRVAIFLASCAVVVVTVAAAGIAVDVLHGSSEFEALKLYSTFLAGAIAIGALVTQVVYAR